jgi:hypothetical protein
MTFIHTEEGQKWGRGHRHMETLRTIYLHNCSVNLELFQN